MKEISDKLCRNEQFTVLGLILFAVINYVVFAEFVSNHLYSGFLRAMPWFLAAMGLLSAIFIAGLFAVQFTGKKRALT